MAIDTVSGERAGRIAAGVVIYARDLDRLAAFYAKVFGLDEVQREPGFAVFERDTFQFVVVAVPPQVAARIAIADPPRRRVDTPVKPVFVVRGIETVRGAVAELGGRLDPAAEAWQFGTWRVLDGHDPEGNVFQLRESIP